MSGLDDRDDRFLALFGQDGELDPPRLNVKHRPRGIALFENFLVLVKFEDCFPIADFGEKDLRVKRVLRRVAHDRPPLAQTTAVKSQAAWAAAPRGLRIIKGKSISRQPSNVWLSRHVLFLNSLRSDSAICRC